MLEEQERNRLGRDLIEVEVGCLCCFERSCSFPVSSSSPFWGIQSQTLFPYSDPHLLPS